MSTKFAEIFSELKEVIYISKRLLSFLLKENKLIFSGMLFSASVPAINPFLNAYIYKLIIDLIVKGSRTGHADYNAILILIGARFITLLLQYSTFSLQAYMDTLLWTKLPVALYKLILSKVASLDIEHVENSKFKDTLQRVRESYATRPLNLYSALFATYQSVLQLLIAFFILATLNWMLSIIILFAALPAFLQQIHYSRILWGVWDEHSPYRKRFWYLSDLIQDRQGLKEMKIFRTAQRFISDLTNMQKRFARNNVSVAGDRLKNSLLLNTVGAIVAIVIEAFAVIQTLAGKITLGSLSYFTFVIFNFSSSSYSLFSNLSYVFNHSLYVRDIVKVLDMIPKIKSETNSVKINSRIPPRIEFRNVFFTYPEAQKPTINGLSFVIESGQKTALVGRNGAGKTTIIKLLARFYDVSEGEILIDGTNIKDLDLDSWYKSLGVIFQDFIKYEYSLADNIHFGKIYQPFNLGKIKQAAKLSGSDSIAASLPQGYDHMLGLTFEGGTELSLGQWQKVALGRAFLRDAPILILDEPTSSLDAKSEKEIFDKVEDLSRSKTVITISHRFSTVKNADKIIVVDKGQLVETGNHKELLAKKGQYAKLFGIQAERYK